MRTLLSGGLFILFLLLGCNTEKKETTTKGNLHVFIPEFIAPVMIDEVNEFLNLYGENGARVTYTIVPSETVVHRFVQDTARIAFLPRSLTGQEKEHIKNISSNFNELIIAYDGIVAVVHPKNKLEQMTTTEIGKILNGKISRWEQLANAKSMKGGIKIFIQDSSDVTEYLTHRFPKQSELSAKILPTSSDLQTLKSVEKDPLSIGFVALGWIDSAKSSSKIINLGRTNEDIDTTFAPPIEAIGKFFSPNPAYIYLNYYPLKRAIYMYTLAQVDLAAGFGTYTATAEGQKLFLKHGLLPGTQRIKIKDNQP